MQGENTFCFDIVKKADPQSGDWVVEGYAAAGGLDRQNDIILPSAFEKAAESLSTSTTVLWNHDVNKPIGAVLEAKGTDEGLFVKVLVSKTVPKLWKKITEGIVNKFSIRGKAEGVTREFNKEKNAWVRVIKTMNAEEISLVSVPANVNARTLRAFVQKALDTCPITEPVAEEPKLAEDQVTKKAEASADVQKTVEVVKQSEPVKVEAPAPVVVEKAAEQKAYFKVDESAKKNIEIARTLIEFSKSFKEIPEDFYASIESILKEFEADVELETNQDHYFASFNKKKTLSKAISLIRKHKSIIENKKVTGLLDQVDSIVKQVINDPAFCQNEDTTSGSIASYIKDIDTISSNSQDGVKQFLTKVRDFLVQQEVSKSAEKPKKPSKGSDELRKRIGVLEDKLAESIDLIKSLKEQQSPRAAEIAPSQSLGGQEKAVEDENIFKSLFDKAISNARIA